MAGRRPEPRRIEPLDPGVANWTVPDMSLSGPHRSRNSRCLEVDAGHVVQVTITYTSESCSVQRCLSTAHVHCTCLCTPPCGQNGRLAMCACGQSASVKLGSHAQRTTKWRIQTVPATHPQSTMHVDGCVRIVRSIVFTESSLRSRNLPYGAWIVAVLLILAAILWWTVIRVPVLGTITGAAVDATPVTVAGTTWASDHAISTNSTQCLSNE